jgi:phage terminase large subunit-like protein
LLNDAGVWLRDEQFPPLGDWRSWVFMGGRGAGKTYAGAHWVQGTVAGFKEFGAGPLGRIALVGETLADVRDVMIEGESGLLNTAWPGRRPRWIASRRLLEWPNGAQAMAFSSEDPESLRGPQFDAAWCDELAKWAYPDATFDMLQFGLRLGPAPRQLITTTPRPISLLRTILEASDTVVTRCSSYANRANLAPQFLAYVVEKYGGTSLGRQELQGELIEQASGSLWSREELEACRNRDVPQLSRIVVSVDPPVSSHAGSDSCGIVVAGISGDGRAWVLADDTVQGKRPEAWAKIVSEAYDRYSADCVVAEANQGGDMVGSVLRFADQTMPVKLVHATRGKYVRAEPIAALYAQGKVFHARPMPELEDQMCNFVDAHTGKSPDRLDALVWALTDLLLNSSGTPKIRGV